MNLSFPVSEKFTAEHFQAQAQKIGKGSGNVVNTDYEVIKKPETTDYFFNFFAFIFSCFCVPKNLNYNSDQIFKKIADDIDNSLSQYILDTAKNPGVSSLEIDKQLEITKDAINFVKRSEDNFFSGQISIKDKGIISIEKAPKEPKTTVTKIQLDLAVEDAFKAHQQTVSKREELTTEQKVFIKLNQDNGDYKITNYERVKINEKWMLKMTFQAKGLGEHVATCSLENFPHDISHLPGAPMIEPFTKEEMLGELQARQKLLEEQKNQPQIDRKKEFEQEVDKVCNTVEPLISAIISRQSKEITIEKNKLLELWTWYTNSLKHESKLELMTGVVAGKYYQQDWKITFGEDTDTILNNLKGTKAMPMHNDSSIEEAKYLEPLEGAKYIFKPKPKFNTIDWD